MGRLFTGAVCALSLIAGSQAAAQEQHNFAWRLLAAHNVERDRAGLPRLAWSAKLAQDAQDWARRIASAGVLQHAGSDVRKGEGENLWMGSAGYYSAEAMVGGFLAERDKFRPGKFPDVSRTGSWTDVGHYTQIIWPATTEVGCAVAKGASDDFLVCRYNPAGNVFGQPVGQ